MSARIDYLTPTRWGEAAYEASQRRKQPVGPAGVPIPSPKAVYSMKLDGKLLIDISKAAFAAYQARELPTERTAEAGHLLRTDLVGRYPQADMAVLARYDMTEEWAGSPVQLITEPIERTWWVQFPAPILLPLRTERQLSRGTFHVDLGGRESSSAAPVPIAAEPYFRAVHAVRVSWKKEFEPAYHWCSMFRQPNGRWPRWWEIEQQFPRVGEWLAEQRSLMNKGQAA